MREESQRNPEELAIKFQFEIAQHQLGDEMADNNKLAEWIEANGELFREFINGSGADNIERWSEGLGSHDTTAIEEAFLEFKKSKLH